MVAKECDPKMKEVDNNAKTRRRPTGRRPRL